LNSDFPFNRSYTPFHPLFLVSQASFGSELCTRPECLVELLPSACVYYLQLRSPLQFKPPALIYSSGLRDPNKSLAQHAVDYAYSWRILDHIDLYKVSLPSSRLLNRLMKANSTFEPATQGVPTQTLASDVNSNTSHGIPIVAVAILGVAGGLIGLLIVWRLYKLAWRFRNRSKEAALLPSLRSQPAMTHHRSSSALLPFSGNSEANLNSLARPYYRFKDSASFSSSKLDDEKGSDSPDSPSTPNSATMLANPSVTESRPDLNSTRSTNYLRSNASRQSMASLSNYQLASARGQPQRRPMSNYSVGNRRLSGAPHSPYSRVEIVPPQPLGIVGNSVVATDKATLNFSDHSGIGLQERETLFNPQEFEGHVRTMSGGQLSAARAVYLAEGPTHSRQGSYQVRIAAISSRLAYGFEQDHYTSGSSSPSHAPASLAEEEGPWSEASSESRRPLSAMAAHQSLDASSSPLDKLTHELQKEADERGRTSRASTRTREASTDFV
jgi:hypothetical protein